MLLRSLSFLAWFGLTWFFCAGAVQAQANPKAAHGEPCKSDSDCIESSICVEVDPANRYSVCLLLCPTGQCLTGEPCRALPNGKKVCRCTKGVPCRSGFPCLDGFCPGSLYCHETERKCPGSGQLLCFQPFAQSKWGICQAPCKTDKDCPPPGTRCLPYKGKSACYCKTNADCKAGLLCVDFHCHTPCTRDKDCGKKEECTGNICEPKGSAPPPDAPPPPDAVPPPDAAPQEPSQELPRPRERADASESADVAEFSAEQSWDTPSPEKPKGEGSTASEEKPGFADKDFLETLQEERNREKKLEAPEKPMDVSDQGNAKGCHCSHTEPLSWVFWGLVVFLLWVRKRS